MDPAAGRKFYLEGHIPGALHLDLERDLSGAKTGRNGRHPLPDRVALADRFGSLGIGANTEVVTYDDADHAGAARLWMMLRWLGHERVRVLNGGLMAWKESGGVIATGEEATPAPASFPLRDSLVTTFEKSSLAGRALVDARAPARYRGDEEPLDPKAGHIPGAKNLFYQSLIGPDGKLLPPSVILEKLQALKLTAAPTFYCGSGVTASVLLLAAQASGVHAAIYPGSWSEWCADPAAPVEVGGN